MSEKLIDILIKISEEQDSNAHGSNKKCFLIEDYALLKQKFKIEDLMQVIQLTEELEEKGIRVAKTLEFKVLEQNIQGWNSERNALISNGYVLQQRAKGNPLLDKTNWNEIDKRYQIDYVQQIDSIANEGQKFFNDFVKGWFKIQNSGMRIDPSKPGNFIYDKGNGITFIDLDVSKTQPDIETSIYEQLCVILNINAYCKCYPEIQQAVTKRLSVIMDKFKNGVVEQGIDVEVFEQVAENKMPDSILENRGKTREITAEEISSLESIISEHLKEEEKQREEIRKKQEEREEKARIEREKEEEEKRRLEQEEERKNGTKRQDSKIYAIVNELIQSGHIQENEASIYKQVFTRKGNIYADINPELFKKFNMSVSLDGIVDGIEDTNITLKMRERRLSADNKISDKTYEQIKLSVKKYFKEHFEEMGRNEENKIAEYSEMKEKNDNGLLTEEEYINFRLLESELYEFSNAKELFSILGIEEKQIFEQSDKVKSFLQEKDKVTEEEKNEIDRRKSEIDREYLYEALQGTGIRDIDELKKIYESQEEVRVSDEDLEAVLSRFSDSDKISPTQIGEDTARAGTSISEIKQSTQEIRRDITKDNVKSNGLDK